ncbi:hypothetical protein DSC45_29245 [Streptomyces sp. YIM 130001]|nr:hypothetical protein DSC45_29245 [Streptomyces sp. YIM 130001]
MRDGLRQDDVLGDQSPHRVRGQRRCELGCLGEDLSRISPFPAHASIDGRGAAGETRRGYGQQFGPAHDLEFHGDLGRQFTYPAHLGGLDMQLQVRRPTFDPESLRIDGIAAGTPRRRRRGAHTLRGRWWSTNTCSGAGRTRPTTTDTPGSTPAPLLGNQRDASSSCSRSSWLSRHTFAAEDPRRMLFLIAALLVLGIIAGAAAQIPPVASLVAGTAIAAWLLAFFIGERRRARR